MRQYLQKLIWALAGAAVAIGIAVTYGVATGQQPGGAPQPPQAPGGQPAPGAVARSMPMQGTVLGKDPQNNTVELNVPQGKVVVQFGQGATIQKQVPAKLEEVKEKDFLVVLGVPSAIDARGIEVVPAGEGGGGTPTAQPPFEASPFAPRPGAWGSASGTVVDLKPLTLEADKVKVRVTTNQQTRILRRATVALDQVEVGDMMMAWGEMDAQKVLHARAASVGQPGGLLAPRGPGRPSGEGRPRTP